MTENDTKWVVFIDALSENDLSRTEFLKNSMQGEMHATAPRVTPRVMSSIYTGLDPAENGMMRSQMFGVEDATRPQQTTVMERAMANGQKVLSLYMPFSIPMNLHQGSAGIGTAMGNQNGAGPQGMVPQMTIPGPSGDLIGDQRHDIVFDHFVDYTTQLFSTARTLAPNYDVVFIGFRLIDSYCHFQYDTNEEGRGAGKGNRYRDKLAEVVDIQIQELLPRGDVLWFSDHGSTKKEETFYLNKWLKEKGYLEYKVDTDFIDEAKEHGMMGGEQHPVNVRVENQVVIGQPGVKFDRKNSQAICADPFDSCITLLDEDVRRDLLRDLRKCDAYRSVNTRKELFNEDGQFFEQTPHIIPDRDEGVFVSGNVHPEPIGMGWYRTGVHDQYGCYGSNTELGGGRVTPEQMNTVIEKFLGLDRNINPIPEAVSRLTPKEKAAVRGALDD